MTSRKTGRCIFHDINIVCESFYVKGSDGLCMRAPPSEPGELVGKIVTNDALTRFDGYSTKASTSKKVNCLHVFTKGGVQNKCNHF